MQGLCSQSGDNRLVCSIKHNVSVEKKIFKMPMILSTDEAAIFKKGRLLLLLCKSNCLLRPIQNTRFHSQCVFILGEIEKLSYIV